MNKKDFKKVIKKVENSGNMNESDKTKFVEKLENNFIKMSEILR